MFTLTVVGKTTDEDRNQKNHKTLFFDNILADC